MKQNCSDWLKNRLEIEKGEPILCDIIREEAKSQGYTKVDLKSARKEIGVKTWNDHVANGETLNWFWYIEE